MKNIGNRNEYYEFGYHIFGPLLLTYADWLRLHFEDKKYKKVFFLARDGYMIEKAYAKLAASNSIEYEYVYFSRRSIRQALLWTCTSYEEALTYLPDTRFVNAGTLLENWGFSIEDRAVIAGKFHIDLEEDLLYSDLKENAIVSSWYYSLFDEINNKSKKQYEYLLSYFQQIGMQGHCAIVDIGWHGNLQFYLEEVIRIANLPITLDGYFLGITPARPLNGQVYGFVYSPEDLSKRKQLLCFFGICERLFQSLEGTITEYTLQENKVVPVLEEYEYGSDKILTEIIKILHDGALAYIEHNKDKEITRKEVQCSINKFIRFGQYPGLNHLRLFSNFYNVDGTKVYYLPQKPIYKFGLKELMHGLSNSTWKTGYMKQLFKVPLPYYLIYYLVRK